MGNDGGSIPTRRELVRTAATGPSTSQLKTTILEKLAHYWSTCPISNEALRSPVVSDAEGRLFNKDAVLGVLLSRAQEGNGSGEDVLGPHVKGLKDVVEARFQEVEGKSGDDDQDGEGMSRWVCPISGKRLGPTVKAVYVVPCGHAFSEEGLRIGSSGETGTGEIGEKRCLECDAVYTVENVIPILPIKEEEIAKLKDRRVKLASQGLAHSLKKSGKGEKKRKNKDRENGNGTKNGGEKDDETSKNGSAKDIIKTSSNGTSSTPPILNSTTAKSISIQNSSTASLTAKVLSEEQERAKRRKLAGVGQHSENLKTLFTSSTKKDGDGKKATTTDFMTRGYSIGRR